MRKHFGSPSSPLVVNHPASSSGIAFGGFLPSSNNNVAALESSSRPNNNEIDDYYASKRISNSRTSFGDRFINTVLFSSSDLPTSSNNNNKLLITTPFFWNSANSGEDDEALVLTYPRIKNLGSSSNNDGGDWSNYQKMYCQTLDRHGFSCNDTYAANGEQIASFCAEVAADNAGDVDAGISSNNNNTNCIDALIFERMNLENERLFYAYLYFATPLVIVGLIFNVIALASIASLRHKLSRHMMLICMSVADTIVSVFALLRRIDGSLLAGKTQPVLIAVWQMSWLLSALSLLGLAIDMFVALAKPYSYDKPFMKRATIAAIFTTIVISGVLVVLLAVFHIQESDNSQYFACGIIMVIITCMCASHIYACVSAEIVHLQIKRSQLHFYQQNDHQQQAAPAKANSIGNESVKSTINNTFFRKSVVTTTLLIMSSLLSWIPLLVYWLIDDATKEANVPKFIRILTLCLICFHLNAVTNPLIYAFRFRDVRHSLKRMFRNYLTCCPEDVRKHFCKDGRSSIVTLTQTDLFATRSPHRASYDRAVVVPRYSDSNIAMTEHQRLLARSKDADYFSSSQNGSVKTGSGGESLPSNYFSCATVNNIITTSPPCLFNSQIGSDYSNSYDNNSAKGEPEFKLIVSQNEHAIIDDEE